MNGRLFWFWMDKKKQYEAQTTVYNVTQTVRSKAEASDASYSTYYPYK